MAAINSVPIVGGDFEERALAAALDHVALNQAAASLYRDRFGPTPGIVYAAGVDHAYNLAQEFRAAGIKATAVSGRTPPRELAETLAAYERGEINVLINAQLLAEGWNSPRATVCMHLAPTASKRVYQQRIGRIMRTHPRKEAGVVVDFAPKGATHSDRVVSLHSLLDADFYREGARVTPAPRRRSSRRARRRLSPAPWLVPVTQDVRRRLAVIQREWQRIDPKFLDDDEQRYWGTIAGRQIRFDQRAEFARKFAEGRAGKGALETFLSVCAAENPNRRLRMTALADRVATPVERADFDDLVTLVTQAPPWEKDRAAGVRILLRAIGDGKATAPDQILQRWTWKLTRSVRKTLDRKASQEFPEGKRLLGAVANSRGNRHEENIAQLAKIARALPLTVGAALLASAEGYTPRATSLLDTAREDLGPIEEIASALADDLPAPKAPAPEDATPTQEASGPDDRWGDTQARGRSRGHCRRRTGDGSSSGAGAKPATDDGDPPTQGAEPEAAARGKEAAAARQRRRARRPRRSRRAPRPPASAAAPAETGQDGPQSDGDAGTAPPDTDGSHAASAAQRRLRSGRPRRLARRQSSPGAETAEEFSARAVAAADAAGGCRCPTSTRGTPSRSKASFGSDRLSHPLSPSRPGEAKRPRTARRAPTARRRPFGATTTGSSSPSRTAGFRWSSSSSPGPISTFSSWTELAASRADARSRRARDSHDRRDRPSPHREVG